MIVGNKLKNEFGRRFINIRLEMLLWLQRAWSSYLRAVVIRGFKNVDIYKTSASIILFVTSGPLRRDGP